MCTQQCIHVCSNVNSVLMCVHSHMLTYIHEYIHVCSHVHVMLMYMPAHICKCLCVNVLTCALVCVHVYSMLLCVPDHMCAYSYVCDAHVCILMSI